MFRRHAKKHVESYSVKTVRLEKSAEGPPAKIVRLEGHTQWVNAIVALRRGEKVVTASWDKTLRIFWSGSGECLHVLKGHEDNVNDVVQVGEDILVSVSREKTARVWRISDSALLETVSLGESAWSVASLGGGHFVVGLGSGALRQFKWNGTTPVVVGKQVASFGGAQDSALDAISVHGNRFATASWDCKAKVWEWDTATATFDCVATLNDHTDWVSRVSLSDSYIVTGSDDYSMCVYDATSFQLQRRIDVGDCVNGVALTGNEQRCVSVTGSGTVNVHDVSTGALLWKWKADDGLWCCTVLPDGRIAGGVYEGYSVLVTPPSHIADQICPTPAQHVDVSTAATSSLLQSALASVRSGRSLAAHECRFLITAENCCVSLTEWRSAHQLLMLAIGSGEIPRTTSFEAKRNWWFVELYRLAKHFAAPDNLDDFREIQKCLDEAKLAGVIETTEAALGDAVLAQQFQDEIRVLHRAGIMICQRLLQIEERAHSLGESFTRYRKIERTSKLVGIALQLIPIAGGAAAGVLSAAAEIVDGLSVKDVTDYALGLVQASDEEVMSFTAQLFGNARTSIAPETFKKFDKSKKRELEELVTSSGYSIETLRILFQNPSCDVETTATVVMLEESCDPDHTSASEYFDVCAHNKREEIKTSQQGDDEVKENMLDTSTKHVPREQTKRLDFRSVKLSRELIRSSIPIDLAKLWATFILRSEEDTAEYQLYFSCIRDVLSENDICGALLITQGTVGEDEVGELVLNALRNNSQLKLSVGRAGWARKFISEVYACHQDRSLTRAGSRWTTFRSWPSWWAIVCLLCFLYISASLLYSSHFSEVQKLSSAEGEL